MEFVDVANGRFYNADCFDVMPEIPDGCVDMVLCDLPYGVTNNKWDSVLSLDNLWESYWRLLKPNGSVILTAIQPFTSILVMSQLSKFKYDWTWRKEKGTGHLNAKKMPMRNKEDVLVFNRGTPVYNPQFSDGEPYSGSKGRNPKKQTSSYGSYQPVASDNNGFRYPKQVLDFNTVGQGGIHPTQKPVELFEYLIKTYTDENDLVLDNCAGSGTSAMACIKSKRRWVCVEKDPQYYADAVKRLNNAQ